MLAPLWTDLTSWLAANAPRMLEWVRPAGDPARLISAEEQLGFALGPELTEWWHLHDGIVYGSLVPRYEGLYGVDQMVDTYRMQLEVNHEEKIAESLRQGLHVDPALIAGRDLSLPQYSNPAGGPAQYFPTEFVPIGYDGAGNDLVVDSRPGPQHGCLRDHDHEQRGTVQPPMFDSLADLLDRIVQSLHTGQSLRLHGTADGPVCTPTVHDGMLSWD